jgi:NADH-quinone oxidoreductase subunit N
MTQILILTPELFLLVMACAVLMAGAFLEHQYPRLPYHLTQGSLIAAALIALVLHPDTKTTFFSGTYIADEMANLLKGCMFLVGAAGFLYSDGYFRARGQRPTEFLALGLFALLGMSILVSASHFLTIYLGLELLSLSLYAMVALDRRSAFASEAAMKYFILGAIASGMLLYGMSMIYGATGQLGLVEITRVLAGPAGDNGLLAFGLVFLLVGIAFKLGLVPFHMWIPDVYQGAATPATLFVGTAPKMAAFAMALRLLVGAMEHLSPTWAVMLVILAALSIGTGNLVAIAQSNIKRMLAYSTIAHMGFLLLGLLSASNAGYAAAMFYAIVYAIMSLGGFGMVLLLSHGGAEADRLQDFAGLGKRDPWLGLIMLVFMFSMAGVPPFAGFWAKWFVLKEVVAAGHVPLAVLAVFFSLIGAYYYLRVVKLMWFDEPQLRAAVETDRWARYCITANSAVICLLGVVPSLLLAACLAATAGY